jgi:hypothetical protein
LSALAGLGPSFDARSPTAAQMSSAPRKPVPDAAAQVPSVMNRRTAAALGLCRHPATAAEGLKLFVPEPGAIPSHARSPTKAGKATSSMKPALSPKPSRFAHLRGAALASRPALLADTGRSASGDATLAFVLNAGRSSKAHTSPPPASSTTKGFASPAACVAFILGAGSSGARR